MSNRKATIYTGTGDDGTTSLIGGCRVAKDHQRVQAYGTIDELNAHLGLLVVALDNEKTKLFIEQIEHNMQMMTPNSELALGIHWHRRIKIRKKRVSIWLILIDIQCSNQMVK